MFSAESAGCRALSDKTGSFQSLARLALPELPRLGKAAEFVHHDPVKPSSPGRLS